MPAASPYWGEEAIWTSKNNVHNPMMDERGRVWITSAVRPFDNPAFCREGSSHPSAKLFPIASSGRHLAVYDPKTKQLTHISTCFGTHHLMFAEDANNTLWTSGGGQVVGWLNTKMYEETKDEVKSQGWTALIMDTNGNGKRDAYVEPNVPVDPTKDKRFGAAFYAASPAPDGSIWGSVLGFPGAVVRLNPGTNPPETALAEVFTLGAGNACATSARSSAPYTPNRRRSGVNCRDGPGRGTPSSIASTSRSTPVSWSAMSSAEENRSSGFGFVARSSRRWNDSKRPSSGCSSTVGNPSPCCPGDRHGPGWASRCRGRWGRVTMPGRPGWLGWSAESGAG